MPRARIGVGLKLVYSLYVAVLVPVYWVEHGPANLLWSSDVALLLTAVALWWENRLLASMMALSVLLADLAWDVDFIAHLLAGGDVFGLNATAYMFDRSSPLWLRNLSLFHLFLPVVLLWTLHRLGYDRRALWAQTLLLWLLLPLSYLVSDPQRNINWVYGLGWQPQQLMPPPLFVLLLMAAIPVLIYLPTHWLLRRWFG